MNNFYALILGAVQGLTEFLPISSSGHLVLLENYFKLDIESMKSFDVALHMGTLCAILIYFRKDVWEMIKAFFGLFVGKSEKANPYVKLIIYIIVGTIPAILLGYFAGDMIDNLFRNTHQVAINILAVAVIFLFGEFVYAKVYKNGHRNMNWIKALVIGIAQSVALVPGISRSGASIVAGLLIGVKREEAARFSFLLGIPAIAGAGLFTFLKLGDGGFAAVNTSELLIGFISSFVFGMASIAFLMHFLKKHSLIVFAVYRILLAGALLLWL
jgi:undecaprenyl-diphosphatase